ncbi:uncharacterized protein GGS25DRAFT_435633 [Hypoxylon fragiforme]|uniref:uncharacterized protein n=1 Tax=Hypoxylon fragiforme TaxID=63214 RepID=UPI0020C600EE|nr:uncharacterized protein GGS25DRAFT_435633 [Hypoxylon fragiforme]KAI2603809.1 hypothetical protein GGS25DRAFT_435633 [Hypoxylon fragiforme]
MVPVPRRCLCYYYDSCALILFAAVVLKVCFASCLCCYGCHVPLLKGVSRSLLFMQLVPSISPHLTRKHIMALLPPKLSFSNEKRVVFFLPFMQLVPGRI